MASSISSIEAQVTFEAPTYILEIEKGLDDIASTFDSLPQGCEPMSITRSKDESAAMKETIGTRASALNSLQSSRKDRPTALLKRPRPKIKIVNHCGPHKITTKAVPHLSPFKQEVHPPSNGHGIGKFNNHISLIVGIAIFQAIFQVLFQSDKTHKIIQLFLLVPCFATIFIIGLILGHLFRQSHVEEPSPTNKKSKDNGNNRNTKSSTSINRCLNSALYSLMSIVLLGVLLALAGQCYFLLH